MGVSAPQAIGALQGPPTPPPTCAIGAATRRVVRRTARAALPVVTGRPPVYKMPAAVGPACVGIGVGGRTKPSQPATATVKMASSARRGAGVPQGPGPAPRDTGALAGPRARTLPFPVNRANGHQGGWTTAMAAPAGSTVPTRPRAAKTASQGTWVAAAIPPPLPATDCATTGTTVLADLHSNFSALVGTIAPLVPRRSRMPTCAPRANGVGQAGTDATRATMAFMGPLEA